MAVPPAAHPTHDHLKAFGLGEPIDQAAADTVAQHLETCADCRRVVAELPADAFLDRLRAIPTHDVTPTPERPVEGLARSLTQPPTATPPPVADGDPMPAELAAHPDYEVVRELGRGGMGVVYLARNRLMDRPEVLKVMSTDLVNKPGAADRFLRELRSAARLAHPNVVRAYSAGWLGEALMFAMEYIEGEDLAGLVRARGPLPVLHTCYYVQQAAAGLQHAHEMGMVHRDVKPANLILTRSGKKHTVKILDFGLAKVRGEDTGAAELTGAGAAMGTPSYMAPEQWRDAATADIRADVYSLGCTLYFLLTGTPPFVGNWHGLLWKHTREEPEPLTKVRPEVPEGLAAVVAKMMAKDPADRFQTPAEVAKALAAFIRPAAAKPAPEAAPPEVPVVTPSATEPASRPEWGTIGDVSPVPEQAPAPAARPARKWWRWPAAACAAVVVAVLGAWAGGVLKVKTDVGTVVVEGVPADAEVRVDPDGFTVTRNGDEITVQTVQGGTFPLKVVRKNGDVVMSRDVQVSVGGEPVRLRFEPNAPKPAPTPPAPAPAAPPDPAAIAALTGKKPAPPADRVAALQRAARDAMKSDLASGTPADLARVARTFVTRADALEGSEERFALLDLARDLTAQAGNLQGALDLGARLDREFLIDPLAVKVRTLTRVARARQLSDGLRLQSVIQATEFEAIAADSFVLGRELAQLSAALPPPKDGPAYAYQTRFLEEELARAEAAYARLPAAAKAATGVTTDPAVNAARGRCVGLVKNDWVQATEFLRAAGEPWRTLAAREEKRPAAAADRVALGDLWWQAADGLPAAEAADARRRARYWYLGGLAGMSPARREEAAARLQPRIDQVPRTPVTLRIRLHGLSGFHWLRISGDGVVTTNRGTRKITGDIAVNHLHWTDHVSGHRNAGAGRLLPEWLDFSTAQIVRMANSRWGAVHLDAGPDAVALTFWHSPANEKSDFDLTLALESAGYDLPSRFARQWDVAYYNWPEKSPPTDEKARTALFAGEPADRLKMRSINFVSDSSPTDPWRPGAPPTEKVGTDRFALAGTTTWRLPAGRYQVRAYTDNGLRVLVDGRVVLDHWTHKGEWYPRSTEFRLTAGDHPIRVEYFHATAFAGLQFDLVRVGD